MTKHFKNARFLTGVGLVLVGLIMIAVWAFRTPTREITRAELADYTAKSELVEAKVLPTAYTGIYKVEATRQGDAGKESVYITTHLEGQQVKELLDQKAKVAIPGQTKAQWISIGSTILIAALVVMLVMYQSNLGKAKNSRVRERPTVSFKEVAGVDEAKAEVQEIVDFLKEPAKYRKVGGKLPKGVLLIGPPGTGKTMLAKAIACEAKANFYSAHGSDFTEVFVGVGAKRVRQLFKQAAKNKPAIIFIDEIDCVGKNRKFDSHSEHQQTINALLAAMDGFEASEGVVVLAATNRPEDLDDALMRPGRFDRKVYVPYPDMGGRRAILQAHSAGKPVAEMEKTMDVIAQTTPGMSGADLANLINEAAILCAQRNGTEITINDMESARDKVRFGKERKSMVLKQRERAMVAYHEAGHTIIHLTTSLLPPLYKVSIVPRGSALGVTTLLPDEDQNLQSKDFLVEELLVLMGGRAAEQTFYGCTTNGASGDLDVSRKIAQQMIHNWGMGQKLYYQAEQRDAEVEINRLLETADVEALRIIQERRSDTEKLAKALLERETLTRDEVLELLECEKPVQALSVAA